MKKFILLLLILPLTLMARPEKKWLQTPTAGIFGTVVWVGTTNCTWSSTTNSWINYGNDDDCDDNTRTKTGFYNITDVTCSDGGAGSCDGAFPRIKFSKMPAGTYVFKLSANTFMSGTTACIHRWSDGTNVSTHDYNYHSVASNNINFTTNDTWITYDKDQGETTISLQVYETGTQTCIIEANTGGGIEDVHIIVYYYPDFEKSRYIITK